MGTDLIEQFETEKRLAGELMSATKIERKGLYSKIYTEFWDNLSQDSKSRLKPSNAQKLQMTKLKLKLLSPFLKSQKIKFLEIGAGFLDLSLEMTNKAEYVFAVEPGITSSKRSKFPPNLKLIRNDTPPYPIETASIDLAFSNHVIEHLHPDDLLDHFREIYRVLNNRGKYICVTPHKMYGPHDVSKHFECVEPQGLHLKEYTYTELGEIARTAGFKYPSSINRIGQYPQSCWYIMKRLTESWLMSLRRDIRILLIKYFFPLSKEPFRPLEQIILVVSKST